jgi:SAM-dependent methyltransferase
MTMQGVTLDDVRRFWNRNPVAAASVTAEPGTVEFFKLFDTLREDDACEPYAFSNKIHGYSTSHGLSVLDVGCGNGYVLSRYAGNGAEVSGVDMSETAVDLTRKRFALEGLDGSFEVVDGMQLPYSDDSFDIVCSMGVLHHSPTPEPMVNEIFRVLKPGGRVIVMLYYRYSFKYQFLFRLLRLVSRTYRGRSQAEVTNMNDGVGCPLARVYSKREAQRLLRNFEGHSFRVNQISWEQLLLFTRLAGFAKNRFPSLSDSWIARKFGWNLYINATKSENA